MLGAQVVAAECPVGDREVDVRIGLGAEVPAVVRDPSRLLEVGDSFFVLTALEP